MLALHGIMVTGHLTSSHDIATARQAGDPLPWPFHIKRQHMASDLCPSSSHHQTPVQVRRKFHQSYWNNCSSRKVPLPVVILWFFQEICKRWWSSLRVSLLCAVLPAQGRERDEVYLILVVQPYLPSQWPYESTGAAQVNENSIWWQGLCDVILRFVQSDQPLVQILGVGVQMLLSFGAPKSKFWKLNKRPEQEQIKSLSQFQPHHRPSCATLSPPSDKALRKEWGRTSGSGESKGSQSIPLRWKHPAPLVCSPDMDQGLYWAGGQRAPLGT